MKIYKCTMEDFEKTTAFYDRVTKYLDENINYPKWTRGEYPGSESTRAAIEAGEQYVCAENGSIIGAFILNDNPQGDYSVGDWDSDLNEGEYMIIHTLAADPEMYGRGIGREMTMYCVNAARERGYKAIRVDVVPTNYPAKRLYESIGFKFAGEYDLKRGIDAIPTFLLYGIDF